MAFMRFLALSLAVALSFVGADKGKDKKPKVALKASPAMGMAPVRVVASADLNGGADDYEEFYCPAIEWDWGDDTKSTTAADCDPYVAGTSQIKRRFTADHTYRIGGDFRIQFRMKKQNKSIAAASTTVKIGEGIGGSSTESSRRP